MPIMPPRPGNDNCGVTGTGHLSTTDLVHYNSHGALTAAPSSSYPNRLGLGTGSVVPSPDGDGVLAFVNNVNGHMVSRDGMQTWAAVVSESQPYARVTSKNRAAGAEPPTVARHGAWQGVWRCSHSLSYTRHSSPRP